MRSYLLMAWLLFLLFLLVEGNKNTALSKEHPGNPGLAMQRKREIRIWLKLSHEHTDESLTGKSRKTETWTASLAVVMNLVPGIRIPHQSARPV